MIKQKKSRHRKGREKENNVVSWFYTTSFMRSLDLDRNYFYVLGLEILCLLALLAMIGIFKHLLNLYAAEANVIAPQAEKVFKFMNDPRIKSTPEVIGDVYEGVLLLGDALHKFLWKTITTLAVLITVAIFLFSLLKGYAWKQVKKESFTKKYLTKFFIANLIWYWAAILLFFWFLLFLKSPYDLAAAYTEIFAFFYLITILRTVFDEKTSLWTNTKTAFYYAIVKLYRFLPIILYFIFFFCIIILFSAVIFRASSYSQIYLNLSVSLDTALLIMLFMLIMEIAWIKFYYYEAYKKIIQSNTNLTEL